MKATRKPPRPEKAIQKAILDFLGTIPGVYAFKTGTGLFPMTYKGRPRMVRMGKVGVSDIVGWMHTAVTSSIADGPAADPPALRIHLRPCANSCIGATHLARFLAVEVKRPGQAATPEQAAFLESVKAAGGIAILATSIDDVKRGLGL